MSADGNSQSGAVSQTRFLVVEADRENCERIERYLLLDGARKVYVAQKPLVALRILQDRNTPVDCVLCAHRPGFISGLAFLTNLRAGRWGRTSLQSVKFILMMPRRDEKAVKLADRFAVSGYIFGTLTRDNVIGSIVKALEPPVAPKATTNLKVAHLRAGEADLIVVPFLSSFGRLAFPEQQEALQAVVVAAQRAHLSGGVAAIWPTEDGGAAFLGPPVYHRFLSKLTVDFVSKIRNTAIHVDWPGVDPTDPGAGRDTKVAPAEAHAPRYERLEEDTLDRRHDAPGKGEPFKRPMNDEDIRQVALAFKAMAPEEFVEKFVRSQPILALGQDGSLTPLMHEYFVSISHLRDAFFPSVNLRGSKNAFRSLTLLLDQVMLRSLSLFAKAEQPYSLNLNIHSVLTKSFADSLRGVRADLLTVEIPQSTITPNFEEFKSARKLLESHGLKFAVDQIFPDTIGLLNLDHLGSRMAKLTWKGELKNCSPVHREFVQRILDEGIATVLTRIDDPAALEVADSLRVRNLQGYLIDDMIG
jgi:EAL domain-containing protein (putative c-di-GMP-specific phosphodiesterase class I)